MRLKVIEIDFICYKFFVCVKKNGFFYFVGVVLSDVMD